MLREDLDKIHTNLLMLADEKVELTNTAYDLLGGHIELLDEELVKFESEITMNTAQQELQQLHQQQADVLAHREKAPIASAVTPSDREDYIKQGDAVAARVSAIGAPDEWILARVMNISSDRFTLSSDCAASRDCTANTQATLTGKPPPMACSSILTWSACA